MIIIGTEREKETKANKMHFFLHFHSSYNAGKETPSTGVRAMHCLNGTQISRPILVFLDILANDVSFNRFFNSN